MEPLIRSPYMRPLFANTSGTMASPNLTLDPSSVPFANSSQHSPAPQMGHIPPHQPNISPAAFTAPPEPTSEGPKRLPCFPPIGSSFHSVAPGRRWLVSEPQPNIIGSGWVQMLYDVKQEEYDAMVQKSQADKRNLEEQVQELKICVAVLENELKHKDRAREDAVNACGLIARALSSAPTNEAAILGGRNATRDFPSGGSHPEILDNRFRMLKREDAFVRRESGDRVPEGDLAFTDSNDRAPQSKSPINGDDSNHASARLKRQGGVGQCDESFVPRNVNTEHGIEGLSSQGASNSTSSAFEDKAMESQKSSSPPSSKKVSFSADVVTIESKKWGESFEPEIPTVPNSPLLPATGPSDEPATFKDVGVESLEDVLGPEGSNLPPPVGPIRPIYSSSTTPRQDKGPAMNKEAKEHLKSLVSFRHFPAPTVLKTGFELKGSFRGSNYDQPIPDGPRGFDRYASLRRSFGSMTYDNPIPSSSFELPNKVDRESGVWSSVDEREAAIDFQRRYSDSRGRSVIGDFFRYGIRYIPSKTDSNYTCTVLISNIPDDVDLRDILARVRGGGIVSASLLDTEKLTGSMTAMVRFIEENSAKEYITYTQDHPIHLGTSDQKVEITLVQTPAWPLATKGTRCLTITSFPSDYPITTLERNIAGNYGTRPSTLVEIYIDEQGTLHLEFSSVSAAGSAYALLRNRHTYRELQVTFAFDPCAGSLDDLALPAPPRPPLWPRNTLAPPSPQHSLDSGCYNEISYFGHSSGRRVHKTRTELPALINQKVSIPSFSCPGLKSSSWADEMIDESDTDFSPSTPTPPSPISPEGVRYGNEDTDMKRQASMPKDVDRSMEPKEPGFRKPPVGLEGSKYLSIVPGFSDLPAASKSKQKDISSGRFMEVDISFPSPPPDQPSSTSIRQGEEEIENQRSQTPPRVNLDSLLESSPSNSSTSSSSSDALGEDHIEQHFTPPSSSTSGSRKSSLDVITTPSDSNQKPEEIAREAQESVRQFASEAIPLLEVHDGEKGAGRLESRIELMNPDEILIDFSYEGAEP